MSLYETSIKKNTFTIEKKTTHFFFSFIVYNVDLKLSCLICNICKLSMLMIVLTVNILTNFANHNFLSDDYIYTFIFEVHFIIFKFEYSLPKIIQMVLQ